MRRKYFLKSEFKFHIKQLLKILNLLIIYALTAHFASKNMYKIQNGHLNVQMNPEVLF